HVGHGPRLAHAVHDLVGELRELGPVAAANGHLHGEAAGGGEALLGHVLDRRAQAGDLVPATTHHVHELELVETVAGLRVHRTLARAPQGDEHDAGVDLAPAEAADHAEVALHLAAPGHERLGLAERAVGGVQA